MVEVPSRLLRQGRPPDIVFLPSERLFRRIHPRVLDDGQLLETALPSPSFSVNREKYSRPEDVLLGHPDLGIFAFRVGDIPPKLGSVDSRVFSFRVEHDPLEDNYAHSEVRTFCNGAQTTKKPPKTVRAQLRLLLSRAGTVLRRPEVGR